LSHDKIDETTQLDAVTISRFLLMNPGRFLIDGSHITIGVTFGVTGPTNKQSKCLPANHCRVRHCGQSSV